MTRRSLRRLLAATMAVAAVAGVALVDEPPAGAATALTGTFELAPGSCGAGSPSGTYLRMILPSGSSSGPFMSNSDSSCRDQTVTPLSPGTDGGLVTGAYQAPPSPVFDSAGNAQARRITAPAQFYGTAFATGTAPVDAQTRASVPAPRVTVSGSHLSADLRAFSVTWNNQYFNQGAPKPDGGYPGNTRAATGTYDSSTGAFTLQWTSQVVGGPFDKFTGLWHLQGRFVPSRTGTGGGTTAAGVGSSGSSGSTASTGSGQLPGGRTTAAAGGLSTGTGHSVSTATSGALPVSVNGAAGASPVASTRTVVNEGWRAQWWLVALTLVIAIGGFAALFLLNRSIRRAGAS